MKIKVCGMRDAENINKVHAIGADMIGLIFYPKSARYVQMITTHAGIIPDKGSITLSDDIQKVGVFVNDTVQNIVTRVVNFKLNYIQLHGDETPTFINNLKNTLIPDINKNIKIIKAINVSSKEDIAQYHQYKDCIDYLLFDTKTQSKGGSGEQFDWDILKFYDGDIPFFLSGGIGPDDVQRIKSFCHPRLYGIDLNSKFESAPAVKNIQLLKDFIDKIKKS